MLRVAPRHEQIQAGNVRWREPKLHERSLQALDFLRRHVLVVDPNTRYTAEKALQHAWPVAAGSLCGTSQTPRRQRVRCSVCV